MPKIVTALFDNFDTARVYGLWQWDYGQVLRIQGLSLDPAVEIHFSLQETGGESTPRIGVTQDGVTDVPIPDSMLENGGTTQDYNFYAWIYITDETSGKTTKKITLYVKSRPKPKAFSKPEDTQLFREAIAAVNDSAKRSELAEKSAESWAHGHPDYPERDTDNAAYYAEQAKSFASEMTQQAEEGIKSIGTKTEESMNAINKSGEDWKAFLDSPVIDGGTFLDWRENE